MARTATAVWRGDLQGGDGNMALGSGAWEGAYTYESRFEEGTGSNPEELIGAAEAGCFSMQLASQLAQAGHTPESVRTEARVDLRNVDGKPTIASIALTTTARVPGLDDETFQRNAAEAKEGCIISRALGAVPEITLDATLES